MSDDIALWPDDTADGAGPVERDGDSPFVGTVRYNVTRSRLHVVRPSAPNGAAAIICPGGGFHFLTMDNEGFDLAAQLVEHGVTCFVLSYRLIETPADSEAAKAATMAAFMDGANLIEPFIEPILPDATQAVRVVRAHADEFGIDPERVAMIGFSAGARMTAEAMLSTDASVRPNVAGIVYLPRFGSHVVPEGAPPLFVVAAVDDQIDVQGNEDLYLSWRKARVPVELHMFESGGHGFGVRKTGIGLDAWTALLITWLRSHNIT